MEIITVTKENIKTEHICCAISNDTDCQVASKKAWLSDRFDDGLVFKKCNVRGKCFIEYIPAEKAWTPIKADGYMYIDCMWVSGQFKGQGNSTLLLDECIKDSKAKGKKGLVILSATKKMPFLADSKYLMHKGFLVADTSDSFYVLYYLPFDMNADKPSFKENLLTTADNNGFVVYYSHQCPYTAKYVPIIEEIAKERNVSFKSVLLNSYTDAQNSPAISTTYSIFYNGKFITNEILSEKKFNRLLDELE